MKLWQRVFREGFAPQFSTPCLEQLLSALGRDDPHLLQGATISPPPLACVQDWPVEAACAVSWLCWQGDELERVGDVESAFAQACFEADKRLGESGSCRHFLNWFDDTPRAEMRRELAAEVRRVLSARTLADRLGTTPA